MVRQLNKLDELTEFNKIKDLIEDNFNKEGGVNILNFEKSDYPSFYNLTVNFSSINDTRKFKLPTEDIVQVVFRYGYPIEEENYMRAIEDFIIECQNECHDKKIEPKKISYLRKLSELENEFVDSIKLLECKIYTINAYTPVINLELMSTEGWFKIHIGNEGLLHFASKYFNVQEVAFEDVYLKDGDIKVVARAVKGWYPITEQLCVFEEYVKDCIINELL